ncbi:MAG: TIGR02452 family protein [Ruminococcus sp.]|nr:TIGR02452 family protein [Ruminococcus sp.]
MNNIEIANETLKITADGFYMLGDKKIELLQLNFASVEVITPESGVSLAQKYSDLHKDGEMCSFKVTNEDSFQAAHRYEKPFVMNFANAHHAGGGFRLGANAQEESLCRCSTLYSSIKSEAAAAMYKYNNSHISCFESDNMLLSEEVCVFRDEKCELLEKPFQVAVVTIPAPNRRGAALIAAKSAVAETMTRRIRIMLAAAADHGYKNLVLGAWGCGAFGNSPADVSEYFRTVLIDEEFGRLFDEVCFAVYGKNDGKNITEFRKKFE